MFDFFLISMFALLWGGFKVLKHWSNDSAMMKDFTDWYDDKVEKGKIK